VRLDGDGSRGWGLFGRVDWDVEGVDDESW
jgi:hypothetical protein